MVEFFLFLFLVVVFITICFSTKAASREVIRDRGGRGGPKESPRSSRAATNRYGLVAYWKDSFGWFKAALLDDGHLYVRSGIDWYVWSDDMRPIGWSARCDPRVEKLKHIERVVRADAYPDLRACGPYSLTPETRASRRAAWEREIERNGEEVVRDADHWVVRDPQIGGSDIEG